MKRTMILTLLLVCSVFTSQGFAKEKEKPRIGVLRFTNNTHAGWWHGTAGTELQDMLINELASTKAFRVLERTELNKVLGEQQLSESGLVEESTKVKPGRIKGARYLIAGTVSSFQEETSGDDAGVSMFGFHVGGKREKAYIAVDLKVIDTETGEIVDTRTVEANSTGGGMRVSGGLGILSGSLGKQEKTPTGKAIRACIIEISDYLECSLANPDEECMKKYGAKEKKRKDKTRKSIELDE